MKDLIASSRVVLWSSALIVLWHEEMEEESNYQASLKLPHYWSQQKWIRLYSKRGFKSDYGRALEGGCGVLLVVEACEPLTLNLPLDHKTGRWWMGRAPRDAFCWSTTSLENLVTPNQTQIIQDELKAKARDIKRPLLWAKGGLASSQYGRCHNQTLWKTKTSRELVCRAHKHVMDTYFPVCCFWRHAMIEYSLIQNCNFLCLIYVPFILQTILLINVHLDHLVMGNTNRLMNMLMYTVWML